ncbi:MAG: monofunctional biosynthetic peptidoglycan transglycosylase [Gammaproteobacteria bacterium]
MTYPSPIKSFFRRLLLKTLLLWLLITALPVLSLRYIAPPRTLFMLREEIGAFLDDKADYRLHYRWADWKNISAYAALAVIAAEDQRFSEHAGFDFNALLSAWKHNQRKKTVRGGSTITQQTAKNLFLVREQSYPRKMIEAYLTVLIELFWPKQRILEMYLNIAQFGEGVFGVGAAAQLYFHKSAAQLTASEAAALASVLPNPLLYRVKNPPPLVVKRRAWIIKQMRQLGGPAYLKKLAVSQTSAKK